MTGNRKGSGVFEACLKARIVFPDQIHRKDAVRCNSLRTLDLRDRFFRSSWRGFYCLLSAIPYSGQIKFNYCFNITVKLDRNVILFQV